MNNNLTSAIAGHAITGRTITGKIVKGGINELLTNSVVSGEAITGNITHNGKHEDSSKINQSQLTYGCGAGNAAVNLFTGRMLFEHSDISVGANSHQISISHVYNADIKDMPNDTAMGNGWKLNVQQYLNTIDGTSYTYIDSAGYKHTFEPTGLTGHFYDTSGLGLILKVGYGDNGEDVIEDENGNQLFFSSGRMIKTMTSHGVIKYYNYIHNRLMSVLDSRKPRNVVIFAYDNNLLSSISVAGQIVKYYYNANNLERIERVSSTESRNDAFFKYIQNTSRMTHAVNPVDRTCVRFQYNDGNRISQVEEGVATITAQGNDISIADQINMIEQNSINYLLVTDGSRARRTTVANRNNIRVAYHFNSNGFVSSILEVPSFNSDNTVNFNNLRTMEKQPGIFILGTGNDFELINGRRVHNMRIGEIRSDNTNNEDLVRYVNNKCRNFRNFTVGFWLKDAVGIPNTRVAVEIVTGSGNNEITNVSEASFDNTTNEWQYVSVPVFIDRPQINRIRLFFRESNPTRMIKMGEARLCYSEKSTIRIGSTVGNHMPLDDVTRVEIGGVSHGNITNDFYLTEKDLHSTVFSRLKAAIGRQSHYYFSHNNGTRKAAVVRASRVRLVGSSMSHDLTQESGIATFFQETISPDNEMTVRGVPFYMEAVGGNTFEGIILRVNAARDSALSTASYSIDMHGNLREETDEYGVRTRYTYDNFGQLSRKEIIANGNAPGFATPEILRIDVATGETNSTINSRVGATGQQTSTTVNYNDPFGVVESVAFRNANETSPHNFTTTSHFDSFIERLAGISNNAGGRNNIEYDARNRLRSVSPNGMEDNRAHEYLYGYDDNTNDLTSVRMGHSTDTLVTNTIERNFTGTVRGTVTTYKHRTQNVTDRTIVNFDRYGRTESLIDGGQITDFTHQTEVDRGGASLGSAEVVTMTDRNEGRTYTYSYDDFNNCTGYTSTTEEHGSFSVERWGNGGDTTVVYNRNGTTIASLGRTRRSQTIHDDTRLLSPRVVNTDDYSDRVVLNSEIRVGVPLNKSLVHYEYDNLGRIGIKDIGNRAPELGKQFANSGMRISNEYIRGTTLKSRVGVNARGSNNDFNISYRFNYRYDERGRIRSIHSDDSATDQYTYDNANRLNSEMMMMSNGALLGRRTYTYNRDGSIASEHLNGLTTNYHYQRGRLSNLWGIPVEYDNLGNMTRTPTNQILEWTRGSLLSGYGFIGSAARTSYGYNNQGVRFRKIVPSGIQDTVAGTHIFFHDGDKLIEEHRAGRRIYYLYDAEGIMGFSVSREEHQDKEDYYFVKDAEGNVRVLLKSNSVRETPSFWSSDFYSRQNMTEVARYEYDAWGNTVVIPVGEQQISGIHVAHFNPIRWKSQYQDGESLCYYIDGRYYEPRIKQYFSSECPMSMMSNAGTVFGLYAYALTVDNPVNMGYNGHTIETNGELAWDPPELSRWRHFLFRAGMWFRTSEGQIAAALAFAIVLIASFYLGGLPAFFMALGMTAVSLTFGGLIAGARARDSGDEFWEGFVGHIRDNWAMSVAISSVVMLGTMGIGLAVGGIMKVVASKKSAVVNAKSVELFRAVGASELKSIQQTGKFVMGPFNEMKQFGLNFAETKSFSNLMNTNLNAGYVAIVKTSVPKKMLKKLDLTIVDAFNFKMGTVTATGQTLPIINKTMTPIIIIPL